MVACYCDQLLIRSLGERGASYGPSRSVGWPHPLVFRVMFSTAPFADAETLGEGSVFKVTQQECWQRVKRDLMLMAMCLVLHNPQA